MAVVQMGVDRFGFRLAALSNGEPCGLQPIDRTASQASSSLQRQLIGLANESASAPSQGTQQSQDLQLQELPQGVTSPAPKHSLALQAPQYGRS
jgi:hypothetical protein